MHGHPSNYPCNNQPFRPQGPTGRQATALPCLLGGPARQSESPCRQTSFRALEQHTLPASTFRSCRSGLASRPECPDPRPVPPSISRALRAPRPGLSTPPWRLSLTRRRRRFSQVAENRAGVDSTTGKTTAGFGCHLLGSVSGPFARQLAPVHEQRRRRPFQCSQSPLMVLRHSRNLSTVPRREDILCLMRSGPSTVARWHFRVVCAGKDADQLVESPPWWPVVPPRRPPVRP